MRAVLVDHGQAGLEGGEDVAVLVLEARGGRRGRFREERCGRRVGRGGGALVREVLVELLPVAIRGEGRRGRAEGVVMGVDFHGGLLHSGVVGRGVVDGDVEGALGVEVDAGHGVELAERLADGRGEDLPDGLLVLELDLGLGRVDIHVDAGGVEGEVDEVVGQLAGRCQALVSLRDGLMEIGVAHVAAVDEEVVAIAAPTDCVDAPDEAFDLDERRRRLHRQQALVEVLTEDVHDAAASGGGGQVHHLGVVVQQAEGEGGVG